MHNRHAPARSQQEQDSPARLAAQLKTCNRAIGCHAPRRWPGIWLNASTDYVCTGNFLLKRHPFTIPFLDLWINSGDVVPELKPFHTWFSWEQRPLNALVRIDAPDAGCTWLYPCIVVCWLQCLHAAPAVCTGDKRAGASALWCISDYMTIPSRHLSIEHSESLTSRAAAILTMAVTAAEW